MADESKMVKGKVKGILTKTDGTTAVSIIPSGGGDLITFSSGKACYTDDQLDEFKRAQNYDLPVTIFLEDDGIKINSVVVGSAAAALMRALKADIAELL